MAKRMTRARVTPHGGGTGSGMPHGSGIPSYTWMSSTSIFTAHLDMPPSHQAPQKATNPNHNPFIPPGCKRGGGLQIQPQKCRVTVPCMSRLGGGGGGPRLRRTPPPPGGTRWAPEPAPCGPSPAPRRRRRMPHGCTPYFLLDPCFFFSPAQRTQTNRL